MAENAIMNFTFLLVKVSSRSLRNPAPQRSVSFSQVALLSAARHRRQYYLPAIATDNFQKSKLS